MSSASSTVTYTSVDTDFEPGRAFWPADEELSDGGSPRVIVYEYDRLPIQPVAPPSPDYIPGLEDPQAHDLDYVPEPTYPEYIPLEDEHVFPAEEQPLPSVDSPTTLSLGYMADSDPEEDPEEDSEEDSKEEHADYPADGGDDDDNDDDDGDDDDDDDDDDDNYDDDTNDKDEEPFEEDEEEEHLALADPSDVRVVDPIPSVEDIEALEPDEAHVELHPTLPSSPNFPRYSHHMVAQPCACNPEALRAAMGRIRASITPCTTTRYLHQLTTEPSPQLPTQPSSLYYTTTRLLFIPPVDRMEDIPEVELPPRKRLCLTTPVLRYERAEIVSYGIKDTWVDSREAIEEIAPVTLEGVNTRVIELTAVQDQDTQEIYAVIEETQDRQTQIFQSIEALIDDRQYHYETARLLDQEALVS
ncbi:hypothetical protein Tco_0837245 [Tanacetum coccineum]